MFYSDRNQLACLTFISKLLPCIIHTQTQLVAEYLESIRIFGQHKDVSCRRKLYEILMLVYDVDDETIR